MRSAIFCFWLAVAVMLPGTARALVAAPHNKAAIGSCGNCHGQHLADSPFWGVTPDYNAFCWTRCHNSPTDRVSKGPAARTHSSSTTNSSRSTWGYQCVACHKPHAQEQNNWEARNSYRNGLYLATGYLTGAPSYDGSTTTFAVDQAVGRQIQYKNASWTPATLKRKTEPSRGALFIPNEFYPAYNYPIYDIAADGSTVTFWGNLTGEPWVPLITWYPFRIIYGQLLRGRIDKNNTPGDPTDDVPVKFFDRTGANSFAVDETAAGTDADPTADGICQACHEDTGHWSAATPAGDRHFSALACTECHPHLQGFKPVPPDHDPLVNVPAFCQGCHADTVYGIHNADEAGWVNCNLCHQTNNNYEFTGQLPLYLDGVTSWDSAREKHMLDTTVRCDQCHHGQFREHVTASGGKVHDKALIDKPACESCHLADVVQEHVTRRGFSCLHCHDRPAIGLAAIDAVNQAVADGIAGTTVYCSDCHNDSYFMTGGSTTYVDEHHLSVYAANGDCIECHLVGPGVDGPSRAPCTVCHGNGGRFAHQHANATFLDLADVSDTRACFSCHLEGGPGWQPGTTPAATPLHVYPSTRPVTAWPGDCWNDTTVDPVNGVGNLPACSTEGVANSYQAENYLEMVLDPAGYKAAHPELTQVEIDAVDALAAKYAGFNIFHDLYTAQHRMYDNNGTSIVGSIMENLPPVPQWNTKETWGHNYLDITGVRLAYYTSRDYLKVPITIGATTYDVISLDGSGGGGKPTGSGNLTVTVTPAGAVADGARWRVDGGAWQGSGDTLSGLSDRADHFLEFKPLAGWAAPAAREVAITDGGLASVNDGTSAYTACSDIPAIAISGPAAITWSNPAQQQEYTVTGWAPTGVDWYLDRDGAENFRVVPTGATSARIEKTGPTAEGSHDFVLRAVSSTCYQNTATLGVTVTVDAEGGKEPQFADTIGAIGDNFIDAYTVGNTYLKAVFHVAGDVYANISSNGNIQTFTIQPDGQISSVIDNKSFVGTYNNNTASAVKIRDNVFLVVAGRILYSVIISDAGAITPVQGKYIRVTPWINATVHKVADGMALLVYGENYYTPMDGVLETLSVAADGTFATIDEWVFASRNWSAYPAAIHVNGTVWAVAYAGAGYDGIVSTVNIAADGTITKSFIDTYVHDRREVWRNYSFISLSGGKYLLAYEADLRRHGFLKTMTIADDGNIGRYANQFEFHNASWTTYGMSVLSLQDNYVAVAYGDSSVSGLFTYRVSDDGVIKMTPKDSLQNSYFQYANLLHVSGRVYVVSSNNTEIRTIFVNNDPDRDGVVSDADNCADDANADQADGDGDGVGDACDNCPAASNVTQVDSDGDTIGDACDLCANDADNDADNDGICAGAGFLPPKTAGNDACPSDNPNDLDGDGVCGDNAGGDIDNCPTVANALQADADCDGLGDACDPSPTPLAPDGLAATAISEYEISLEWNDKSGNETGFRIWRCPNSAGCGSFPGNYTAVAAKGAGSTLHTDNWLAAGTAYTYRVEAVRQAGCSWSGSYSGTATTTTMNRPAPTDFTATPAAGSITLAWHDATLFDSGFVIERCNSGTWTCGAAPDATFAVENWDTDYVDVTVTPGQFYTYRVKVLRKEYAAPAHPNDGGGNWALKRNVIIPAPDWSANTRTRFRIPFMAGMQPDFDDIRFYDETTGGPLNYWIESKVDSLYAIVWVKTWAANDVVLYYSNPDATAYSNDFWKVYFYDEFKENTIGDYTWNSLDTGYPPPNSVTWNSTDKTVEIRTGDGEYEDWIRDVIDLPTSGYARFKMRRVQDYGLRIDQYLELRQDANNLYRFRWNAWNAEWLQGVYKVVGGVTVNQAYERYGTLNTDNVDVLVEMWWTPTSLRLDIDGVTRQNLATANTTALVPTELAMKNMRIDLNWKSLYINGNDTDPIPRWVSPTTFGVLEEGTVGPVWETGWSSLSIQAQ